MQQLRDHRRNRPRPLDALQTSPLCQLQATSARSLPAIEASMHKTSYRFVHLSDIHFGQEKNGTLVIHTDARNKLIEDCRRSPHNTAPRTVSSWLVTLPMRGSRRSTLLLPTGSDPSRRHAVVRNLGSHDPRQSRHRPHAASMFTEEMLIPPSARRLLSRSTAFSMSTLPLRRTVTLLPKIAAYREFASRFDCDFPSLRKPCWVKDYPLGRQYAIRFLGMNSVQVCDGDDARGKMVLGNNQYVIDEKTNVVPISLIHHPLTWFMDEAKAKPYLHRSPVLLFGHEHVQGFEKVENQYGQVQLHVFSGAVNPPEGSQEYPFRYNWLEFQLAGDPQARQLSVALWPKCGAFKRRSMFWTVTHSETNSFMHSMSHARNSHQRLKLLRRHAGTSDASSELPCEINEDDDRDFERLKYFFWTYLDWQEPSKCSSILIAYQRQRLSRCLRPSNTCAPHSTPKGAAPGVVGLHDNLRSHRSINFQTRTNPERISMLEKTFEWERLVHPTPTDDMVTTRKAIVNSLIAAFDSDKDIDGAFRLVAAALSGLNPSIQSDVDHAAVLAETTRKHRPAFPSNLTENARIFSYPRRSLSANYLRASQQRECGKSPFRLWPRSSSQLVTCSPLPMNCTWRA